jgi:hypothetical protein
MKFFDPNNPNEKKKMIAAAGLGLVALLVLGYVIFGGGSSKPSNNSNSMARTSPTPRPATTTTTSIDEAPTNDCAECKEVVYSGGVPPVSDASRNIFAFYIPPSPTPTPVHIQTPTPTPLPPLTANSLSPSNVYARTPTDFTLQVSGDKFTSAVHIFLDGRDLPTRFINAQQLFATVPASFISNPGVKTVVVQTPDRQLYSNPITLNVTQPPVPNYTYVGLIGKPRANDTAVLQDKSNKDLLNVQRGDPVGSRFKVVSISDREVKLIDTALKITHTIPFSTDQASGGGYRPPVRTVDDEP